MLTQFLTNIANAIRAKTGKTEPIAAQDFATEIENIETGGDLDLLIEGSQLTEVNLPRATKIKDYAFYYDKTLKNITMPNVTEIGYSAFDNGSLGLLTELPEGLTKIGKYAFRICSVKFSSFPSTLEIIGEGAFSNTYSLGELVLNEGLTEIGNNAFYMSKAIISEIPSTVTKIGYNAFMNTSLTSLTFKGTPTSIGTGVFPASLSVLNVPWAEGAVKGAPWGATNATINYNYTGS